MGVVRWSILIIGAVFIFDAASGAATDSAVTIAPHDLVAMMRDQNDGSQFTGTRKPTNTVESVARRNMKEFIKLKMSQIIARVGGKGENHFIDEQGISTTLNNVEQKSSQVSGTNFIAVLSPKNNETKDEDEPLLIIANYDTDATDSGATNTNPVEDNGSGLAAMLVVADFISKEIEAGKYKLKHPIVFAATDASIYKYANHADGAPQGAPSGADLLASEWLPKYLEGRKGLRGVIVLDNILNFQDEPKSQNVDGMDRAYPEAYQEMSKDDFRGNFLALVTRGDDLDRPLAAAVEKGWEESFKQKREQIGGFQSNATQAKLIRFDHNITAASNPVFLQFLQSDQRAFWNHGLARAHAMYPAVLLTDTRTYRKAIPTCSGSNCNLIDSSATPRNLAFAYRTILALHSTIVDLQSSATANMAGMLTLVSLITVALRQFSF